MALPGKEKTINKIKKRVKSQKGMTLSEVLVVVLILLILTSGMISGVSLAVRQYRTSMQHSEAEELYSTLKAALSHELRNTPSITVDSEGRVLTFFSTTYAIEEDDTSLFSVNDKGVKNTYGELVLGVPGGNFNKILSTNAYPRGLGAKASVTYDGDRKVFRVCLTIAADEEPVIEDKVFEVRALSLTQVKEQ